jgi:hypothetical protein
MRCANRIGVAAAAVVLVGAAVLAGSAQAYELQMAPSGEAVRWQHDEVVFDLSPLAEVGDGVAEEIAGRVLETWSAAGGPVLVAGASADAAMVTGSIRWASNPSDPGVDPDVLAVTHLKFDSESGEITRADIVVNGARFRWAAGDSCSDAFDLESTLAHEMGHALGLKHSAVEEATMFTRPAPCARERRDLAADDVEAIADLYSRPTAGDDQAATDGASMGGCSAAGTRGTSGGVMLLLVVAAVALARSRMFLRR